MGRRGGTPLAAVGLDPDNEKKYRGELFSLEEETMEMEQRQEENFQTSMSQKRRRKEKADKSPTEGGPWR